MNNEEITSLKQYVKRQQERRIELGEWPERENLTSSFCNCCQKLFEEIDFRDGLISDLKSESTGYDLGREAGIEWVMKHLQEEMDKAVANPEKRTFRLPIGSVIRTLPAEPTMWVGGTLVAATDRPDDIGGYEVSTFLVQNDYISIIKKLLEAWRTKEQ